MTTLRHSPDFNLILMPNTNVFFASNFPCKIIKQDYWLVIMTWWWHCVETWHAVSNIFLPQIWGEVVLVTGHAVKLWSSQYLCHIDTSPASLICDHSHDTTQYGRGSWISDGQLEQSFHYMMKTSNSQVQTLPNQIRSRELWQELVMIVLSCPHPTLGCVLCTRPGQTQLCAAEIRGAVCQRYISFVYSLV